MIGGKEQQHQHVSRSGKVLTLQDSTSRDLTSSQATNIVDLFGPVIKASLRH